VSFPSRVTFHAKARSTRYETNLCHQHARLAGCGRAVLAPRHTPSARRSTRPSLWNAKAPRAYSTGCRTCFCPERGPVTITVRNGHSSGSGAHILCSTPCRNSSKRSARRLLSRVCFLSLLRRGVLCCSLPFPLLCPLLVSHDSFDENPNLLEWRTDGVYFTGQQKTAAHLLSR